MAKNSNKGGNDKQQDVKAAGQDYSFDEKQKNFQAPGKRHRKNKQGGKYWNQNKQPDIAGTTYGKEMDRHAKLRKAENDPSWYIFSDQIATDGGNVQSYNRVGVNLPSSPIQYYNGDPQYFFIPSLMSFEFIPTVGEMDMTKCERAAVNLQTVAMWKAIQQRVQKELPFTHGDLAQYLFAMDSIYMLYFWAKRVYGVSKAFDSDNITVPNVYLESMGLDVANLTNDMGWEDYRKALNLLSVRINTFKVPATMKILERHTWLVSHIFKDSESYKASQYIFNPGAYYEYLSGSGSYTHDAVCDFKTMPAGLTLSSIIDLLEDLVDKALTDMNLNTMQGWLMRAYDPQDFFLVDETSADYIIKPEFVAEVLPQIHNMRVMGPIKHPDVNTIGSLFQHVNNGVYQGFAFAPDSKWGHVNYNVDHLVDVLKDKTDVSDNYVATRFMVTGTTKTIEGTTYVIPRYYGTEIIARVKVYSGRTDGNPFNAHYVDTWEANVEGIDVSSSWSWQNWLPICRWLHFEMGPMLLATTDKNLVPTYQPNPKETEVVGNITNVFYLTSKEIATLHVTAVMGEWMNKYDFTVK